TSEENAGRLARSVAVSATIDPLRLEVLERRGLHGEVPGANEVKAEPGPRRRRHAERVEVAGGLPAQRPRDLLRRPRPAFRVKRRPEVEPRGDGFESGERRGEELDDLAVVDGQATVGVAERRLSLELGENRGGPRAGADERRL